VAPILDADGDATKEFAGAEALLSGGVDGVVLFSGSSTWDDFVQRAVTSGIYVFTYNPGPTAGATMNIRKQPGAAAALGEAAAAWINSEHGGDAKFAVLAHSSEAGRDRAAAMRNGVLANAPNATPVAEIVAPGFSEGATATEYLLSAYPDLGAVLSFYDEAALGVLEAATAAGKTDPADFWIGGFMGIEPALKKIAEGGLFQATISFYVKFNGVQIMRDMVKCLRGEEIPPTRENRFELITRANVETHKKLLMDPLAADIQYLYDEIFSYLTEPLSTTAAHRA
jgi:ABC-type sugar transport system substrate-binding protein